MLISLSLSLSESIADISNYINISCYAYIVPNVLIISQRKQPLHFTLTFRLMVLFDSPGIVSLTFNLVTPFSNPLYDEVALLIPSPLGCIYFIVIFAGGGSDFCYANEVK